MTNARFRRLQAMLAQIAAVLFVVQSVLLQVAGASPAQAGLDIFGNPLCITGETEPGGEPGGGAHSGLCCLAACSGFAALSPGAPESPALHRFERARAPAAKKQGFVVRPSGHNPSNPRAPPRNT